MGPMGLPPNMSHDLMFQSLAQAHREIQSYSFASAGYRNGALIMARVNVL